MTGRENGGRQSRYLPLRHGDKKILSCRETLVFFRNFLMSLVVVGINTDLQYPDMTGCPRPRGSPQGSPRALLSSIFFLPSL